MFLHRVLGLYDELSRAHIPKQGLRYWFTDHPNRRLDEMTEIGPDEVPRLPAFQLDREKLDEHLIAQAAAEGIEVARPAKVTEITLGWPVNRVRIEDATGQRELTCRWVVDASGRAAMLARKRGTWQRVDSQSTAAMWGRWSGVKDMDGAEVLGADPRNPRIPPLNGASRRLGTNHFCSYGKWFWVIPLAGGETSIGIVYDKKLFSPPTQGRAIDSYRELVKQEPGLRELVAEATLDSEDFHLLGHLAYRTSEYAGKGFALVGDAAAFMDPYYSPGLDQAGLTTYGTARIIEEDLTGALDESQLEAVLKRHNEESYLSYDRWLSGIYTGKYEIFGDAELTYTAFMMDTALYYLAIVSPIQRDLDRLRDPVFGRGLQSAMAARFVIFFNTRMRTLARNRQARGSYGRRNIGWRVFLGDVGLGSTAWKKLAHATGLWANVELHNLVHPATLWPRKHLRPQPRAVEPEAVGTGNRQVEPLQSDRRPSEEAV